MALESRADVTCFSFSWPAFRKERLVGITGGVIYFRCILLSLLSLLSISHFLGLGCSGSYVLVSSTVVCQIPSYASETAIFRRYWYLTRSNPRKRWYQQVWCVINMLVPVRYLSKTMYVTCLFRKLRHKRKHNQTPLSPSQTRYSLVSFRSTPPCQNNNT